MRLFGLIGFPLSHSFSRQFFTDKFLREGITDAIYKNFPLTGISQIRELVSNHPELCGLNVTIPYKEQVIPFLDKYDDVVKATGACNCIRIADGRLDGYNTDVTGFRHSLKTALRPEHTKALILGKGGAAKAVAYILETLGIDFLFVVRRPDGDPQSILYSRLTPSLMKERLLIINTTPLGMLPDIDSSPPLLYDAISPDHYLFDLVYNPAKTRFLEQGEERGATIRNGADMLVIQAEESWKIWEGARLPVQPDLHA